MSEPIKPASFPDEERIDAYLAGNMTDEERVRFERELQENSDLRVQLDQARNSVQSALKWYQEPVPGLDRLDEEPLSMPPSIQPVPAVRRSMQRYFWQVVGAAAIFLVGYLVGIQMNMNPSESGSQSKTRSAEMQIIDGDSTRIKPVVSPTPLLPGSQQVNVQLASAKSVKTIEEDGRIIFETQLSESRSRAVWIVDGRFNLPDQADINKEEN